MSSATSTESDPLQPWQLFTLAGLIGATIVVFVSKGHTPAGIILLSLTIFAAAAVGIAAWRTFGPLTGSDEMTMTPVVGGRTRAVLDREKTLVMRSLKELEFDHQMGKVSDKDFVEMGGRLRLRAAGLLRQLDMGTGYREQIQKEVDRRLGIGVGGAGVVAVATGRTSGDFVEKHACAHCGVENDADARFCKSCGASLEASE